MISSHRTRVPCAPHTLVERTIHYFSRRLEIPALFGLAALALLSKGLHALGLHPLRGAVTARLPGDRVRVVFFIPSLGLGGAQRQLVALLAHLDRSRYDPEVVTLDSADKHFEPMVRALAVPVVLLRAGTRVWMLGAVRQLVRRLYARPCQVLHCWMHRAVSLGAIAGALAGVPVVIGSLRSQRPSHFPWAGPSWLRGLDMLSVPLTTVYLANSHAVRDDNQRWALIPPGKLEVIYSGVECGDPAPATPTERNGLRSSLRLPKDSPLVGIIGRLEPEKDHATFLSAAERIAKAKPGVRFLIIGDGRLRAWIEHECRRLGLGDQVRVLGARKDVGFLLRSLDVLVLTSTHEGLPNVLLEAAAAGIPVVSTAAGGAAEIVLPGQTGFLVPCGQAAAAAERVLELLGDDRLRHRMAGAARERARTRFAAEDMARQTERAYERGARVTGAHAAGRRPTRICFISHNAYGLLWPSSGHPFGGAEVQVWTLANELARDPLHQIVVLTGGGERLCLERAGPVTVALHRLCGRRPIPAHAHGTAMSTNAHREPAGQRRSWLLRGKQWLSRRPPRVQAVTRALVRTWYACRKRLDGAADLRWLVHRARECRELLAWVRLVRALDADVYVMRCASPQAAHLSLACRLTRRRFVYMVAHEDDVSGAYVRKHGTLGKRFEHGLRHADAVVCQHAAQVETVRARYAREAMLIRSLCPFPVGSTSHCSRKTVLWIARADPWKQPDLFLALARRMPGTTFVMVAPQSQIDPLSLPRLAREADDLPNLRLLAGVPLEETARLFDDALVFVNTSRSEGFPNTFLQAAASGTPIVSWAIDPEGMLERFEIGYCAGRRWDRLEGCVRRLCDDERLRERLGGNGRRYVLAHHRPSAVAARYADLFASLTGGRRAREEREPPGPDDDGGAEARDDAAPCVHAKR